MNKNSTEKQNILIAAAWPYANGSLHLGHVAALIGADVLARYFRLDGNNVLYVSGSDCHGTPIVLEADRLKTTPDKIAIKYHEEFSKTLIDGLNFSYDNYTNTMTENHKAVVQEMFLKLYEEGNIYKKIESLPYCEKCARFLPDRYVEGECPNCHFTSARGDQCDGCGNLMDTKQLINPKCKICGSTPKWRESEHFFLKLTAFEDQLKDWVKESEGWRLNAKNFTLEFLNKGLIDRAITRDTDWGIGVPLPGYEDKRIYVWFEAVCGYLSASKEWAQKLNKPDAWQDFWQDKNAFHYYVHGKDNIPFHSIIWPAILLGQGNLHLPDRIISSEYLTLEKKQFSKSRHFAVWLPDFLAEFDCDTLRYYLIMNGSETSDADFSWSEFATRTNSELIGTFGNFVYRVLSFIDKNFSDGVSLPAELDEKAKEFLNLNEETFTLTGKAIAAGRFREALRTVFKLIEEGNKYINDKAPWKTIKTDKDKAAGDLAVAAYVIKSLAILIKPFLPISAEKIGKSLGLQLDNLNWFLPQEDLIKVTSPEPLYKRIEEEMVKKQEELLGK